MLRTHGERGDIGTAGAETGSSEIIEVTGGVSGLGFGFPAIEDITSAAHGADGVAFVAAD